MLFLEDLSVEQEFKLGSISVSKEEIIDFAKKFDPQAFHLDDKIATKMFGGLIASGWHTSSLFSRLVVDGFLSKAACMASPGLDQLLFLKPVYADDVLTGKFSVLSIRQSKSKPDRGLVKLKGDLFNEKNEAVLSMVANIIIGCRPVEK